MLLALKVEEGAKSQGMWEASRSWKGEGNGSSSFLRKRSPNTLILAQRDCGGLLTSRT